jgi:hypothetical protein
MRWKPQVLLFASFLSLVCIWAAAAKKPKPVPCPPGHYLLPAGVSALTGDSASEPVPLALQDGQSTLGSCTLATGAFKANKKHITTVIAKSPKGTTCGGFKKVLLKVTLPADCRSAIALVKAKKFKPKTFQAAASVCGDGVVDQSAGEQCDGQGCSATETCSADCTCQPIPTTTTIPLVSTTSTTSTTTTSTTTTTLIGRCLDPKGNLTDQQCTSGNSMTGDCPTDPANPSRGHLACCGDGITPEVDKPCDQGLANCPAGVLCGLEACTADCKLIGQCTGSSALCVDPAQSCQTSGPAGQGCCGNGVVDLGTIETCDDGESNGKPGDSCPSSCEVLSCTPQSGTSQQTSVTYTGPAGVTIAGISYLVDYPEGKVRKPTFAAKFGVSVATKDLTWGYSGNAIQGQAMALPSPFMTVTFETCQGAPAAVASDFTCKVTDASDDNGNTVDPTMLTCAVTIP